MDKQHFSVARVVTHTKEDISKFERHDERKNKTYSKRKLNILKDVKISL